MCCELCIFSVCLSFTLVCFSFYLGHPMKTMLFLILDRPAILTYQSSLYIVEKRKFYCSTLAFIHYFFLSIRFCSIFYIFFLNVSVTKHILLLWFICIKNTHIFTTIYRIFQNHTVNRIIIINEMWIWNFLANNKKKTGANLWSWINWIKWAESFHEFLNA